jgi:predicted secreted protein
MACISGKNGALSVDGGSTNVAQLTAWTITQNAETIEASYMGADWKCIKPGMSSWEGSAEAVFDTTEVYPTIGAVVDLVAYEIAGTTTYSGSAIVTSIEASAGVEDMITASLSFTGDGALTTAA